MARSPKSRRKTEDKPRIPYHEQVANTLIKQLESGTAPWQKPWAPGSLSLPHNPVSGTRYRGGNALWLQMHGRDDPRWMTYKQAQSVGAQVGRGEKGTLVQYYKFHDQVLIKDDAGKPLLDAEGNKRYRNVELERPKVFTAVVFNAEQIEGLPALQTTTPNWDRHERAEALLKAAGVEIRHDQVDRAFYRPATDKIHLPPKDSFSSADRYYITATHETAHATGHPSRLNRDIAHPFGSEGYAKEELRAEIASLMIGERIGIGHDPGQHAAYVENWIKVLKDDPKEILRAARDADKISDYLLAHEKERLPANIEKLPPIERTAAREIPASMPAPKRAAEPRRAQAGHER